MNSFRETREPIYNEKERLKSELLDIKGEYESSCIALNTLNVQETEAQRSENQRLEGEHLKLKRHYEEESGNLKKLQEGVRALQEKNSNYEMSIAEKKEAIRATTEKIIRSPMKTIKSANDLKSRQNNLQEKLKNLIELDGEKKKVLVKEKDMKKDVLLRVNEQISCKFFFSACFPFLFHVFLTFVLTFSSF